MPPKLPEVDEGVFDEVDSALFEAQRIKGQLLKKEAQSIANRSVYFGNKIKDSIEKYKEAADFFMTGNDNQQAIDCFEQALILMEKKPKEFRSREKGEVYLEISECLREIGVRTVKEMERLEEITQNACILLAEDGKFYKSAGIEKDLAKFLEEEGPSVDNVGELEENYFYAKAIEHYKNAGEMFQTENSKTSMMECFLKCAEIYGLIADYSNAMKYFEKVASVLASEKLTAFNAREPLLRSFLCKILENLAKAENDDLTGALCQGYEDLRDCYDRYCEICIHLDGSLEGNMILKLIESVKKKNPKEMASALKKFDKMKTLDSWNTTLLLKIKEAISVLDLT
ncbi:NSF attachment protein [Naegleria gruberi]|uniref:NSF attachment protein n=1 Tax=Naegleria gruberi TaxID=5762 RepID=D2VFW2_NAEGR|nr:NSF attachment protein [Naegleria gruberi]EFC44258.1 NSF attachment protein [Naegleria gruberi]|eukprot:XP_002677002.1 NSF attachment protein [Naegleria gruberi strain NEG-M]